MTTSAPSLPESLISTLSGHYYTDSEVFALEQEKIFETMWVCVVRSSDLDKPGAFKTVQVGRESVLVTRSRKGDINAFFNICRHRGARLCTEDNGEVKRAFQCPYHAWTYDLDGKLIAAPNLTKMPDIDRVEYGTAQDRAQGVARLRVGVPGGRTAVVRRHRDEGSRSIDWVTSN